MPNLSFGARCGAVLAALVWATDCAQLVGADFDRKAITDRPDAGSDAGDASIDLDASSPSLEADAPRPPDTDADGSLGPEADGEPDRYVDVADRVEGDVADAGVHTPCPPLLSTACGASLWSFTAGYVLIPYDFEPGVGVVQHNALVAAMGEWTKATLNTIVFQPATGDPPHLLRFVHASGCGSARRSDVPIVAFAADGCMDTGRMLHELGRVMGLEPTQQRSDRDRYLQLVDLSSFECGGDHPVGLDIAPKCDANLKPGGDFGVFDFDSIMLSPGLPPDGGARCGTPPLGDRMFVRRSVVDVGGPPCASDVAPNWNKTRVTLGDGAAVVELYRTVDNWSPFRSLGKDKGPQAPLDIELAQGVTVDGNPAVTSLGFPNVQAVVRGTDGNVWTNHLDPAPRTWENLGAPGIGPVSDPSVVSWSEDETRIDVVMVSNQTVYRRAFNGTTWDDWDSTIGSPPGKAQSPPAIASGGFGLLSVYVTGSDGQIWMNEWSGSKWNGWSSLPSLPLGVYASGGPSAAGRTPDIRDVVVRGTDGGLYYLSSNGSFSSVWTVIGVGGTAGLGRPSIAPMPNQLNVFVRSVEGQLSQVACRSNQCESTAAWSTFFAQGGVLASDPAACSPHGSNYVDIIVASVDGAAFPMPSSAKGLWLKRFP